MQKKIKMNFDITKLIGETTDYDKKRELEVRRPKSWCKSVCAFANGNGGSLIFGISKFLKVPQSSPKFPEVPRSSRFIVIICIYDIYWLYLWTELKLTLWELLQESLQEEN